MREGARARAKEKGLEYNLEHGDVFIPEHCPVLGIKLKPGGPGGVDSSPTLDRINNTKGYVKGNVIVVSRLANQIKSTATYQQVRRVAEFYEFLEAFPEQAVTPPLDHLPRVRELFLTPEIVRAIRADPRKSSVIAKEYGLRYCRVSDIKARRTWAKLPDDEF